MACSGSTMQAPRGARSHRMGHTLVGPDLASLVREHDGDQGVRGIAEQGDAAHGRCQGR